MNKVSIIIPCFNSEKYIDRAIKSALNQNYDKLEVIVIDNDSTDSSYEKICSYDGILVDKVENIHECSWHEPTRRGMELMTGDYFMILASDDYLDVDFISNNMKIIRKKPNLIKALQSPVKNVGGKSGIEGYHYKNLEEFKQLCLKKCPVKSPTVVWSREVYEKGLMETYPERFKGADDYWMYCNQADKGLFIFPSPKYLGYNYNWHSEQQTWNMISDHKGVDDEIQEEWRTRWT